MAEERKVTIYIDGKQAGKSLSDLQKYSEELSKSLQEDGLSVEEFIKKAKELDSVTQKVDKLGKQYAQLTKDGQGLNDLREYMDLLNKELANFTQGTPKYAEVTAKIKEAATQYEKLNSIINGTPKGEATIKDIREEVKRLTHEIESGLIPGTAQYEQALERLGQMKSVLEDHANRVKEIEAAYKNTAQDGSINTIKEKIKSLEKEVNDLTVGTKQYEQKVKELRNLNNNLDAHQAKVKGLGGSWDFVKNQLKSFAVIGVASLGASELVSGVNNLIKRNGELSDSMADVQKTTGLTAEEVKDLYKEFKKIDTRTANKELLNLAYAAGKLGKTGKEDILGFVRAADKLFVALGDSLQGDAEQIAVQIGKVADLFKLTDKFGTEQSLLKIGSAINTVGQAGSANEGYLVDFVTRLGGIGSVAGFSVDQLIGVGSVLDELGVTSEVSTTALGQLFANLGKNVDEFAKLAKLSVTEYKALLNEDVNAAFIKVLEGAKSSIGGPEGLVEVLKKLGVDGQRSGIVVTALTENIDLLNQRQQQANASFADGTSILNEFAIKNETLGAKLDRIRKTLAGMFVNSGIVKFFELFVNGIDKIISRKFPTEIENQVVSIKSEQLELNTLVTRITSLNEGNKERSKLIGELNQKYPNFLGNLKAETVSNSQLRDRLTEVNNLYIQKILLTRKENEIKEISKKVADAIDKETKAQLELNEATAKANILLQQKYGLTQKQLTNIKSTINELDKYDEANFQSIKSDKFTFNEEAKLLSQINGSAAEYNKLLAARKEAQKEGILDLKSLNDQIELIRKSSPELAEFFKPKVIVPTPDGSGTSTNSSTTTTTSKSKGETEAEKAFKEKMKNLDEYNKRLQELQNELFEQSLIDQDKELNAVRLKYIDLRKEAEENHQSTKVLRELEAKEVQEINDRYRDEEINKVEDFRDVIFKIGKSANELEQIESARYYEGLLLQLDEYIRLGIIKASEAALIKAKILQDQQNSLNPKSTTNNEDLLAVDAFKESIYQQGLSEEDQALNQLDAEYEAQLSLLDEFNRKKLLSEQEYINLDRTIKENHLLNSKLLSKQYRDKELEEEKKVNGLRVQAALSLTSAISDVFKLVSNESARSVRFEKAIALAQIGISSAIAISKSIAAVVASAAAKSGPAFLPVLIAESAVAISTIVGMFASVKNTLNSGGNVPAYFGGGLHTSGATPEGFVNQPTFFSNSSTGQPFIAGEGYKKEYIISNSMLQVPQFAHWAGVMEAYRQNRTFENGGSTQATASNVVVQADPEMKALLMANLAATNALNDQIQSGIGVNYDLLIDSQERINKISG